ncbi:MAG: hypothetical protein KatS3mg132_797 [Limisphaera sp.]|nr:MAG: hypothetical protein KatS3mg132_797 [Limisphaera sp.]
MRWRIQRVWVSPEEVGLCACWQFIRGHWAAMENGSHYRRDVSLGEDACRIRGHNRAQVMATLRNVVLGLFELQKDRGRTRGRSFPSWRRRLTVGQMIGLIIRGP